jgi:hypothetical protein
MTALGSSEGTDGKDLVGEILLVKNIDEFNALSYADIKDKIIFFTIYILPFLYLFNHINYFIFYVLLKTTL